MAKAHQIQLSNATRSFPYRHPLFRRIYLVFFLLLSFVFLIPFWTVIYLPRTSRPRRSWTLKRCLRVRWSRLLCGLVARCEIDYLGRDLDMDLDPLTLRWSHPLTIPPAPPTHLLGHAKTALDQLHASRGLWIPHFIHRWRRDSSDVWGRWNLRQEQENIYGFAPVKAFWYTGEKEVPSDGDPIMIHFHGGGYICGTAAETDLTSSIPKSIVKHSPIHHVLSVDYRLAPTAPWPLPLLDAISTYHHLVKVERIRESDIIVAGDSAGGHLALALTRWVRDEGAKVGLKMPRGLVLISPWADVGFTSAWGREAMRHNKDSDTIDDTFGPFACSLLLRALPAKTMHNSSYLSPASLLLPFKPTGPDSFEGFPSTYIAYGGAERLSKSIELLWTRLQSGREEEVVNDRIFICPDAVHDFIIFPWMSQEASTTYSDLDDWLRELLSTEGPEEIEQDSELSNINVIAQQEAIRQRISLQETRARLRTIRSPTMGPVTDDASLIRLMENMGEEGISMFDLTSFDLELPKSPDWLTPLTGDLLPENDLDDDAIPWYELDTTAEAPGAETRKDI